MKKFTERSGRTLVLLILLSATSLVLAQQGKSNVQRVRFPAGRTTVVLKGKVADEMIYVLRASEGQTLTVHLAAEEGLGIRSIKGPGVSLVSIDDNPELDRVIDWSGEVPTTGDYRITLNKYLETDRALPYTLEVTIR